MQGADPKQDQAADPEQSQGADPKLAMVAVPEADDAVGYDLPEPVSPVEGGDAEASPAGLDDLLVACRHTA